MQIFNQKIKTRLSTRSRFIADFILARIASQKTERVSRIVIKACLRLQGFNNYGDESKTGEKHFLEHLISTNPEFCIDIGANVGHYSKLILANSNSKVLAFEPQIQAFNEAKKLALIYPDRMTVVNVGVADNPGELTMYYGNESESATFSSEANEIPYVAKINSNSKKVPVVTLDGYMKENSNLPWNKCSLLKIDTEGYEAEVLMGAQEFITTMKPTYIQIEFNIHHLYRNHNFKMLAKLVPNYKPFRLLPFSAGMLPCENEDVISNIFQYSNYVYICKEGLN